jgi:hypothetical protein
MPSRLRRLLHRTDYFFVEQTGGRALPPSRCRYALRNLWSPGTAGVLRGPAAIAGDVWFIA